MKPQVPVKEAMLLDPALIVGVTPESKNPEGPLIVMAPATGIAVEGEKLSVTDAGTLPAMRSAEAIANDTDVTACAVAMNPEATG